jgi:Skp family chaperone for outer membrane proteins
MKILQMMILTILLTAFLSVPAPAQNRAAAAGPTAKIATVDLHKVFNGYWKTKQAQAALNERKAQLDKDEKGMIDDLNKANEEYQQLRAQANDQAISADERDKRKQAADDKLKRMQDSRSALDQFDRQAKTTLSDQTQRMSDNIYNEIKAAVTAKAKAAGYLLVVDTSAQTINIPLEIITIKSPVVYSASDNDLTDDVLKQLNAGAPIDLTAPAVTAPPPLVKTNKS